MNAAITVTSDSTPSETDSGHCKAIGERMHVSAKRRDLFALLDGRHEVGQLLPGGHHGPGQEKAGKAHAQPEPSANT